MLKHVGMEVFPLGINTFYGTVLIWLFKEAGIKKMGEETTMKTYPHIFGS